MKTWNQLFIQHGWLLQEKEENVFDCKNETEINLEFLIQCLERANARYLLENRLLTLLSPAVTDEQWLDAVDFEFRGRAGYWFDPGIDQPKVHELDPYISGVVRQLNRLGFFTAGSCDGHGERNAHVVVTKESKIEFLMELLIALGFEKIHVRENRQHFYLGFHYERRELLRLAGKLSLVKEDWLEDGIEFIKERLFHSLLSELLEIPGVSGEEELVRNYVIEKLSPFVDHVTVDRAGNILAEKIYRGGNGPVVLLNAHLDTVIEFAQGRKIIQDGNKWSSSKGILGADDRAGVAVLLHLAEFLPQSSFNGKVKFIFTVEEECGLVGARLVDDYFLWGIDAAIVVDRRGKGDIVTSCGGSVSFCHENYGAFFEKVAVNEGLDGWKMTQGGSSDTRIWAEHGIQSINLSVGYMNEHTEDEFLDVEACYETVKLLEGVFGKGRDFRMVL